MPTIQNKKKIHIISKNKYAPTGPNNAKNRNNRKKIHAMDAPLPANLAPLESGRICSGVFQNQKRGNHPNNIHQRKADI